MHSTCAQEIQLGNADDHVLRIVDGLVYYGGRYYGDWSVFGETSHPLVQDPLTPFDPQQAIPPNHTPCCDCELPGYFQCGVPGILAHMENGRIVPGFHVERCDACRRFDSDTDAEAKLRELGLFAVDDPRSLPLDSRQRTYSVHCYATVRVKLPGIPAIDERDAARKASELFDWDRYQAEAEYADEITEFLVDVDGEGDFRRSKRFAGDLQQIPH